MQYGYKREVEGAFPEVVERTKLSFANQGFGTLLEIDIQETFKRKLGVELDRYVILGVCNPSFAYEALQSEKDIGLLLPCNVIVYEARKKVSVATILPTVAMSIVENAALANIAKEVEAKLKAAVDAV